MKNNFKVVAFDMDGVLTKHHSSWDALHEYFEVDNSKHLKEYLGKEIDYEEFMKKDISLWPKVKKEELKKIFSEIEMMPYATELIAELKKMGFKTVMISAGIDVLAEMVGEKIKIDYIYSNGLETDDKGCLTGNGICRVDLSKKNEVITTISEDLGIPLEQFIAVGDTYHDIPMLELAGLGIAFNPHDEKIKKIADHIIEEQDLKRVLDYIKKESCINA